MGPLIDPLSPKLLWVDDDGRHGFVYEQEVLRERGWGLLWATTTAEAAATLAKTAVAALVTDNRHPLSTDVADSSIWGGYQLVKWLRGDWKGDWGGVDRAPLILQRFQPLQSNSTIPVLILSAFWDEVVQERFARLPQADEVSWLAKPMDDDKLVAFLEAAGLCKRARSEPGLALDRSLVIAIQEIEPAWDALRRYLASNPHYLHQMDPRRFELLVAEMFRDFGWQVELTARTRDGGYDIVAVRHDWSSNLRLLVEAKRFSPNHKVGVGIVRSLYGVKSTIPASQAVLATSSYVSADAKREFARVIPWELDFIERDKILAWCSRAHPALLRSQ